MFEEWRADYPWKLYEKHHVFPLVICAGGRSSLVVKIMNSWSACHKFKSSTAEDCCREPMHVSISRLKRPRWCGVEARIPHVSEVCKFGDETASSGIVFVTSPRYKIIKSIFNSPHEASKTKVFKLFQLTEPLELEGVLTEPLELESVLTEPLEPESV
ncbi:hypothetical protein TNCV_469751 [Trichonephila clavipes]|nr:hypothetical protein TNCV_469751 [Trichonephila clavipes]